MTPDPKRLRALLEGASRRPWKADLDVFDADDGIVACVTNDDVSLLATIGTDHKTDGDAAQRGHAWEMARRGQELRDATLIVEAVNALPALLAVYEAAEAMERNRESNSRTWIDNVCEALAATRHSRADGRATNG